MNSKLQNKLVNLHVEPPAGVWDKIAASLDEQMPASLSQKLFEYQERPPQATWLNIAEQLELSTVPARVVPMKQNVRRSAGLIAAAAILIVAAVATTFLINRKSEPQRPAQTIREGTVPRNDSVKPLPNQADEPAVASATNTPKPHKPQLIASTSKPRRQKTTIAGDAPMVASYLPRSAARKDFTSSTFSADKYMIYSDDDGNAVRLPKKIFAAYVCPDESDACKQRLQQLRERFAESAVTADFTGLLEILKSLQENQ